MSDTAGTMSVPKSGSDGSVPSDAMLRNILGVDVRVVDRAAAISEIRRTIETKGHRKYAFLNAHGGNLACKDATYRSVLKDFHVLPDGVGVDLGSKILWGEKFPENLNGTDFIPRLFKEITKPLSVVLVGAKPGIAERAAIVFKTEHPHHEFSVLSDGYFDFEDQEALLGRLADNRPDVLLVAFGNPKQEIWIAEQCSAQHVSVPIGVGALFDFVAGSVPRAPQWMISARIEWLFRLWLEPARMWKRYILGNPLFILRVLKQKLFGSPREKS